MAKIKAHPRVLNPKKNQRRQQQRRRPKNHVGRSSANCSYSSSCSAAESESTFADETHKITNQMDILALVGGSSSEKRMKKGGRGRSSSAASSGLNSQQQNKQPFSVLMEPKLNKPKWVKSREQLGRSRSRKVVGDLLAGSLVASVPVDDTSSDIPSTLISRNNRTEPARRPGRQQRRSTMANRGLSSVLVGAAASSDDNDDDDDGYLGEESVLVQKPKSQGHVLRRAYAAVGKEMQRSNKSRGESQYSSEKNLVCGLISMFGVPETKTESKDRLPRTRNAMPSKPRSGKKQEAKRVAFASGTKPILSVLEAVGVEEQFADLDRLLERPTARTAANKSMNGGKEKDWKMREASLNSSADHSSKKTNDAKCLSTLLLEVIGSPDETITPTRMDFGSSPLPLRISDQMDLLDCLDRCHIDDANHTSSRKRMEEASPEMKVEQKRHDRKKTPGKGFSDSSMTVDHTSPSACVPENSQSPIRAENSAINDTDTRKSAHSFLADIEESLSDLSDDEFFADLQHQCAGSLSDQDFGEQAAIALAFLGDDKPAKRASVHSLLQPSDEVNSQVEGTTLTSRSPAATGEAILSGGGDLAARSVVTSIIGCKSSELKDSSSFGSKNPAWSPLSMPPDRRDESSCKAPDPSPMPIGSESPAKALRAASDIEELDNGGRQHVSSCKVPHSSPMMLDSESPAKALRAASETEATVSFVARRSRRQRIATDRFTIPEHTTGGYYIAPQPTLKASHHFDDCSEGNSSEIIFCDRAVPSDSELQLKENVLKGNFDNSLHGSHETADSPVFKKGQISSSHARTLQQRPWRSRRERKQTDFFHQLNPEGSTGRNRKPPEKFELVDTGLKSMDSSSQDRLQQSDGFKASLRSRRERKHTSFYHDACTTNRAMDAEQSDAEVSAGEQSLTMKDDAVQEITARQGPRRVRRFPGRKPLVVNRNLEMNASPSDNDWSPEEMEQLSVAMATVDPTTELFWYSVASHVRNRTESECRAKWFSVAKTPVPKLSKKAALQQNEKDCGGDEDDLFNASPKLGFLSSDIDESESRDATGILGHYFGSAIKASGGPSADAVAIVPAKPISFRPKAGYKTYLQNLKRDVSRAEKTVPSRKAVAKTTGPSAISESVFEDDVDVNVRLTPGGTLKIKSQYEDEGDDDFWGDYYDAEAEDE